MEERRKNDVKTALVAIAKDEGPYIREWVVYHKKVCGFDEIFVYENDSSDSTRSELESMAAEGLCGWKPWPRSKHNPPQQLAYRDAVMKKNKFDWLCFLDVDEFLVLKENESIGEFVSRFDERTGSISLNWVIFYSTEETKKNEPVIKRVNYCHGDTHIKTIARTSAISRHGIHAFWLSKGYKYMHCSGREYKLDNRVIAHVETKMCMIEGYCMFDVSVAQINHYSMKSVEEVIAKDTRGRATKTNHVQKNGIKHLQCLFKKNKHQENHSIKKYIDSRIGLEYFYRCI